MSTTSKVIMPTDSTQITLECPDGHIHQLHVPVHENKAYIPKESMLCTSLVWTDKPDKNLSYLRKCGRKMWIAAGARDVFSAIRRT